MGGRRRRKRTSADDASLESWARSINEMPWEPLPGMNKLRCEECLYWFATPGKTAVCIECSLPSRRRNNLREPHSSDATT
jgi:hypothetical protein